MRALVTGAAGQLGIELLKTAPSTIDVIALTHSDCDITSEKSITSAVLAHSPHVVINAAAYTAVDKAERERDAAQAVNATGAGNVARACEKSGARLIHVSTDYVFDGLARRPYSAASRPNPLSEYGKSKLAGEREIENSMRDFLIIRSGWLYAPHSRNFLLTILSALKESRPLAVVNDQTGVPTASRSLARAIWKCSTMNDLRGIQHWVDRGLATWFDFAVAIASTATRRGLVADNTSITPVSSEKFGAQATRPAFSVLDARPLWEIVGEPADWRSTLEEVIGELA